MKFKMQYLVMIILIACISYFIYLDLTRSNEQQKVTLVLGENGWECIERKNKIIMLNGQPRNTTVCVLYKLN